MLKIIASTEQIAVTEQISRDLAARGKTVTRAESGMDDGDLVIAVLSTRSMEDSGVRDVVTQALDRGLRIVLVITEPFRLPRMIDHLPVVDFGSGATSETLNAVIDEQLAAGRHVPLKVITPSVQRANRRTGLVIGLMAVIVFLLGLYGIGVLGIQAPIREFNTIETLVALTIDPLVAPRLATYAQYLPADANAAIGYEATARAVPTQYRNFVERTATQYAANGYSFATPQAALPDDDVPAVITLTPSPTPAD